MRVLRAVFLAHANRHGVPPHRDRVDFRFPHPPLADRFSVVMRTMRAAPTLQTDYEPRQHVPRRDRIPLRIRMDTSRETACWECEAMTSKPVIVSVAIPPGEIGPLPLCPSCYRTCYVPLIAE